MTARVVRVGWGFGVNDAMLVRDCKVRLFTIRANSVRPTREVAVAAPGAVHSRGKGFAGANDVKFMAIGSEISNVRRGRHPPRVEWSGKLGSEW